MKEGDNERIATLKDHEGGKALARFLEEVVEQGFSAWLKGNHDAEKVRARAELAKEIMEMIQYAPDPIQDELPLEQRKDTILESPEIRRLLAKDRKDNPK